MSTAPPRPSRRGPCWSAEHRSATRAAGRGRLNPVRRNPSIHAHPSIQTMIHLTSRSVLGPMPDTLPKRNLVGLRVAAPLIPAVFAFGVSFGVLARASGFDGTASIAMSLTTFAGSAQFAAVSVLGAGGTLVAAIAAAILLNVRYGPMALSAASAFRGGALRRLLEAQLLVDESWALSQRDGGFDRRILIGAGLGLYAGWSGGTAVGVVAGDSLADPATLGLDAAFPALFLALLAPLVRDRRALAAALLGAGIAVALTPVSPA